MIDEELDMLKANLLNKKTMLTKKNKEIRELKSKIKIYKIDIKNTLKCIVMPIRPKGMNNEYD
jgi:predicted patatin/cPLA2 family phospholipase